MSIASTNPASGEVMRTFEELSDSEIDRKLTLAWDAFLKHRKTDFSDRAQKLRRAGEILDSEAEKWGRLMTQEMGKTLKSSIAEAKKCALGCRFFAERGQEFLSRESAPLEGAKGFIYYLPIGPVLAVMPWNFPFWQVFRFAAPALMAGNVGVLKHASNVPQSALAIEEILRRAGFPEGVFQALLIGSGKVPRIIDDPRIRGVTLTGSDAAGSQVASAAGKTIKKTVLELGGSDPFIVMPSANLQAAVKTAVNARTINNGQSCIAAKRFIVHERIYDAFQRDFVAGLEKLKLGDPMRDDTDVGPLATPDILKILEEQVNQSVAQGAKLLTGGKRRPGPGNFYLPGALAEIPKSARVYREEVFGPVALLFKVRNIDEAIQLANESAFGLGSSVWTQEDGERRRFIEEIEAGATFINAMVASDPRLPFGGVKRSGYGRELSREGIREFVNIKAVQVAEIGDSKVG